MARNGGDLQVATPLGSPTNKVKFLCSHGGKILPRSPDGQLKYVGGETRVVSVPRDISFSEFMRKLKTLCNGEMVLKYQIIPGDLDILVSVTSDEDLRNMLNEIDRWDKKASENGSITKLRAFLFTSNEVFIDTQTIPNNIDRLDTEQRYIDAINGYKLNRSSSNKSRSVFSISSNESSPRSIQHEGYPFDTINHKTSISNGYEKCFKKQEIHRVNSSPLLNNLGSKTHHLVGENPYYQSWKQEHSPYKGGSGLCLVTALSVGQNELRYYSRSINERRRCGCIGYGNVDEFCRSGRHEI